MSNNGPNTPKIPMAAVSNGVGGSVPLPDVWKSGGKMWLTFGSAALLLGLMLYQGYEFLFHMWFTKEEYSHAILIPFISLFLVWQQKDRIERLPFTGSWTGLAILITGGVIFLLGQTSSLAMLMNYSMVIVIYGFLLSIMGWQAFRLIQVPVLMLAFMVPLPGFLYETLSAKLQLLSSQIGVAFIRMFGISVHLDGNVIDLGAMKLQVVEACAGLRYLFPLTTLGFITAYFYNAEMWKRAFVFLSSIPITILMNSFRIGAIGVLVEYWGIGMAEGFLHDFEGWAVFMACTSILVFEMWLLTLIGNDKRPFREVFGLTFPESSPRLANVHPRKLSMLSHVSLAALAVTAAASIAITNRSHTLMPRSDFSDFPLMLGTWKGTSQPLEKIYLDILRLDDHISANYADSDRNVVNLFVSYYATQQADRVPHSPRACLPGGGWQITEIKTIALPDVALNGSQLGVNRVIIKHGDNIQLVYYWFQQRGRNITSEYMTKWFLFWDALTSNRSDGSLVRLTTPIGRLEDLAEGDHRLSDFASNLMPILPDYVPN